MLGGDISDISLFRFFLAARDSECADLRPHGWSKMGWLKESWLEIRACLQPAAFGQSPCEAGYPAGSQ